MARTDRKGADESERTLPSAGEEDSEDSGYISDPPTRPLACTPALPRLLAYTPARPPIRSPTRSQTRGPAVPARDPYPPSGSGTRAGTGTGKPPDTRGFTPAIH
ncbi:uncharacterized protein B0H18DRAFT_1063047 [Fomitopsis serialis]|uniref:uncharacterized protein n=1 Tax=Fomitopsis serialis TaxID=139415 RepID=UPI002008044F|nr:uncharacterized protein B0H18DRAFT_1063047 [Neoantrodia serialis]KAH9911378.1 hypothetical protein B0H18DRAFT_1063047 [Neoantrodia serialis]